MKGLMICNRIRLPYRVMRCMTAAGLEVHVLGNPMARGLRFSRSCSSFTLAESDFNGDFDSEMAEEINRVCRQRQIDMVFPGCALAARSFHGVKEQLEVRCFPGPNLDQFDLLNNKWEFVQLCWEEGISVPETSLVGNRDGIRVALQSGRFKLPIIAKPLAMDGERGVVKLTTEDFDRQIESIDYTPVLVQEFIEGDDIGASVFCKDGDIVSYLSHHLSRGNYSTFTEPEIYRSIEKISARFKLNGVYNFDMRRSADGSISFLECNPRFFFKMPLSLAAGINFALPGISNAFASQQATHVGDTLTRTPRAWPRLLLRPWTMTNRDRALSRFLLSDPISFLRELVHLDWD